MLGKHYAKSFEMRRALRIPPLLLRAFRELKTLTIGIAARRLGVSVPTAAGLLTSLEAQGVVRRDGTHRTGVGRAARRYALVPDALGVLLLDAGSESQLRGWVVDLLGEPRARSTVALPSGATYQHFARAAVSLSRRLLRQTGAAEPGAGRTSTAGGPAPGPRILGTVVSVPGVYTDARGVVVHSTNRVIEGMPISRLLKDLVPPPLIVVNDANLAATGAAVEAARSDVVFLLLANGVGMGIYLDYQVRHGAFGFAGEIGHLPLGNKSEVCYCGQRGCLERILSLTGMAERLAGKPPGAASSADVDGFVKAVERGDPRAVAILDDAREVLADLAIVVANILDPDTIMVGTPARPLIPWLRDTLESTVQAQVLFKELRPIVITPLADLDRGYQLGAVELALRYQPVLARV